jgi:hypothetical protein
LDLIFPVTAAAAATKGLANKCEHPDMTPFRFLFEVDKAYFGRHLSSFIAIQAAQPLT